MAILRECKSKCFVYTTSLVTPTTFFSLVFLCVCYSILAIAFRLFSEFLSDSKPTASILGTFMFDWVLSAIKSWIVFHVIIRSRLRHVGCCDVLDDKNELKKKYLTHVKKSSGPISRGALLFDMKPLSPMDEDFDRFKEEEETLDLLEEKEASAAVNNHSEATQMLEAALQQMDGIIAGKTKI